MGFGALVCLKIGAPFYDILMLQSILTASQYYVYMNTDTRPYKNYFLL